MWGEKSLVDQKHHVYYLKSISFKTFFLISDLWNLILFYSLNEQKNKYQREQSKIPTKHNVQKLGKRGLVELRKSWDNWATASHQEVSSWHLLCVLPIHPYSKWLRGKLSFFVVVFILTWENVGQGHWRYQTFESVEAKTRQRYTTYGPFQKTYDRHKHILSLCSNI